MFTTAESSNQTCCSVICRGIGLLLTDDEVKSITCRVNLELFAGKSILITGGTGLLGAYLVEAICRVSEIQAVKIKEILILSQSGNFSALKHLNGISNLNFHETPLLNTRGLRGFDFFLHAASPASPTSYPNLQDLIAINSGVLEQLMSPEMSKVVFISAGEIYGPTAPRSVKESFHGIIDNNSPRSAYPIAKFMAENRGLEISNALGIQFKSVRLFHTFGPGLKIDDGRSFADFIWQVSRGRPPQLKSRGSQIRTFLYTEDFVVALIKIFQTETETQTINVGSENPFSILEFATRVSVLGGMKGCVDFESKDGAYIESPIKIITPNTEKLKGLGWTQLIDLDESILRTLRWVKSQGQSTSYG